METLWTVAIALSSATVLSIAFNPILIEVSSRFGWYEKTNHRTIHTGKIPYIGGVAIFYAFIVGVVVTEIASPLLQSELSQFRGRLILFAVCFAAIHILGLVDDFRNILARYKLLVQIVAAGVISFSGFNLEGIRITQSVFVTFGPASHLLTILWFVGISNAVNLIDGMDGLSGATSGLAALFYGVTFLVLGNLQSAVLAFALLGGVVGFLLFNWPQGKIFMGDNGALFLGFALATLPFFENSGIVRVEHMLIPLSLLFFPLFDTFMAIGRRIRRRRPLHRPDKEHIHHKLLALGYSQGRILIMLIGVFLLPAVAALLTLWLDLPYSVISVGAGWAAALLFFAVISRRYKHVDPSRPG